MIRLIILLISSFTVVYGQQASLEGVVRDAKQQVVPGVSVRLIESKRGKPSDAEGKFTFQGLKPGMYTLQASFVGYKTLQEKVNLVADKTLHLDLELVEASNDLKEIVVVGYVSQNEKPITIGKLPIKPMDLPQSVVTLDKSLLEAQQVNRMSDVLMNTNGVYIFGATGGYQEEIAARGFSMASSNTFKNGMRYANGMISELSGVEKVEILKGSAAILYGNVAAGGVLNLVTKKPKFNFGGEISLRTGSWGMYKPSVDVYGGLSQNIAVRLNASAEQANSFRVGVSSERVYVNPSILFKLSKKTELILEGDYLADQRTPDFGAGIINYQIVDIPRERFLGVAWSNIKSAQSSLNATLTHQINEHWTVKWMSGLRQNSSNLFSNTRPNAGSLITSDGQWIRNLQKSEVEERYGISQLDFIGSLKVAGMKHQVLLGVDSDFYDTDTYAYNQFNRYDTVNVYSNALSSARNDQPAMTPLTKTMAPIRRFGIYAQDLIHLNEQWKVLAGIRYSYQQTLSDVYNYTTKKTTSSSNFDGAFSPRLGIVYKPSLNHAFFASYSNSFTLNTGVDINNQALPPSLIDQYEVGVKNDIWDGLVSVNVTAYRILNNNLAQNSLVNATTYSYVKEMAGSVQSEGIELDLMSKPVAGFSFSGGYSFNETKYVKSNTYIEGSLLKYNPRHTANVGIQFRHQGLQVGLTTVYIGERFAGRSTRVLVANDAYRLIALPAYLQADLTAGYTYKKMSLRARMANLGDVINYNVHDDNSVNPITPRNYSLTLTYGW
ncbi:TonB-dependent receptor [Aquirufa sp. LEPPI-3A]|uniref:TonB-dependent receptor n=1 Tax=Aquirufa regiilacus TaxID=3024868 RepID=UPI0028DD5F90|nr:TonB-dependent receptor [Aquirufa sp. LEPPI-3A]MDT8887841.1 TonB-dependent receptor [Aquirufa sp. LEPPI-3A]